MSKRKTRDKIKVTDKQMLKPLNIEDFGSDDDPCFGKLFDLATAECKRCGDSEICGVVFAQKLNTVRTKVEEKHRFKDIELEYESEEAIYIKKLKGKGFKAGKIIRLVKKKYNLSKQEVKNLL